MFSQETQRMCTVYFIAWKISVLQGNLTWSVLPSISSILWVATMCQITNKQGNMVFVKVVKTRTDTGICGLCSESEGRSTGKDGHLPRQKIIIEAKRHSWLRSSVEKNAAKNHLYQPKRKRKEKRGRVMGQGGKIWNLSRKILKASCLNVKRVVSEKKGIRKWQGENIPIWPKWSA